jgi:hypothetical protein
MERSPIPRQAPVPSSAAGRADPAVADDGIGLTRADLRYLMQQYANAPRTGREAAVHYAYPAGFVVGLALWTCWVVFHWLLAPVVGALSVVLGMGVGHHERRWRRERFAFHCPECRENLMPGRAELAMASGRCPACGHELFAA